MPNTFCRFSTKKLQGSLKDKRKYSLKDKASNRTDSDMTLELGVRFLIPTQIPINLELESNRKFDRTMINMLRALVDKVDKTQEKMGSIGRGIEA